MGKKKILKSLREPRRQGRVFSPSAARTDSKYTSQRPHAWVEGTSRSAVSERNVNTYTMYSCRFQWGLWEESWNRRPKDPDGNNKNTKKTQKHQKCQRNIRVWTQALFYRWRWQTFPGLWSKSWNTVNCKRGEIKLARNFTTFLSYFMGGFVHENSSLDLRCSFPTANCCDWNVRQFMEKWYDIPWIRRLNLHLFWIVIKWNVADLEFSCFLKSRQQLKKANSPCVIFNHCAIKVNVECF